MPHDLLDRAFVSRLRSTEGPAEAARPVVAAIEGRPEDRPTGPTAIAPPAAAVVDRSPTSVLDRLIDAAPAQWAAVATAVERANADRVGPRDGTDRTGFVVAVVARRQGDGCTTFVEGLARTLRDRGLEVVTTTPDRIDRDLGSIQVVDAGTWFGAGPIRRERATALADTCDAAILLRRADRSTAAAFARALEVAGVHVLGEVTTFGRDSTIALEASA